MARPKKESEQPHEGQQDEQSGKSGELVCVEIGNGSTYCNCFVDISQLEAHINAGWRIKPPNFG